MMLLAACAVESAPPRTPHTPHQTTLTVVDAAGRPTPGAQIELAYDGPFACDIAVPIGPAYMVGVTGTTDAAGRFVVPRSSGVVRAVAPDGAAGLVQLSGGEATLVVEPTATITVVPRCGDAGCGALVASGYVEVNGAQCTTSGELQAGRIVLPRIPHGKLTLFVYRVPGGDDKHAVTVHAAIVSDTTLEPELP